jgi:uncharacterized iron-regulated protein
VFRIKKYLSILFACFLLTACGESKRDIVDSGEKSFVDFAYNTHQETLKIARVFQESIRLFLKEPSEQKMFRARKAWAELYKAHGQMRALLLDDFDQVRMIQKAPFFNKAENIVTISTYLQGDDLIDRTTLRKRHSQQTPYLGLHVMEYLLWGERLRAGGSHIWGYKNFLVSEENERLRQYLQLVVDIFVDDFSRSAEEWSSNSAYTKQFLTSPAMLRVLKRMIFLSKEVLIEKEIPVALSGKDAGLVDLFSAVSHNDFLNSATSIQNVYLGYNKFLKKSGLCVWLAKLDPRLAKEIERQIALAVRYASSIPGPLDSEVTFTQKGSLGRQVMQQFNDALVGQVNLLEKALVLVQEIY